MSNREKYVRDIIEYLRHKEREYRERDVLNENHKLGGFVYLQGMIQDGTMTMKSALQIKPLLDDPYTDYEIDFIDDTDIEVQTR